MISRFSKAAIATLVMAFIILLMGATLSGCKTQEMKEFVIIPEKTLQSEALEHLTHENYSDAAKKFKMIFEHHPDSPNIQKSELMYAYCLYMRTQYEEAYQVYSNYLVYFPTSPQGAYVKYMIMMCFYNQIADITRGQHNTEKALQAFLLLEQSTAPNNQYRLDGAQKAILMHEYLAAHEMLVGAQYASEYNPVAAINRFKKALDITTSHNPEALFRIAQSYTILGLDEQAARYLGILKHNYPNSAWYRYGLLKFRNYPWFTKYMSYIGISQKEM